MTSSPHPGRVGVAAPVVERRIAVAFSGGRDSTALLHSVLRSAAGHGLLVVALHVNHGLNPLADRWQASLAARCADWKRRGMPLRFVCERIAGQPAAGDSVEAWARQRRYQALCRMATDAGCDAVLLAHHRRDQAETFLLQALRGGGMAGLASMPAAALRDGISWLRPWLDQPRSAIESYIARHRLQFIDDDSNADPRFARNRLRSAVWPALLQAFPQAEQVLGDSARWAAQAAACLREVAAEDLSRVADGEQLLLARWLELTPARRSNALRAWLQRCAGRPAPATLIERLLAEAPGAAQAADPHAAAPRGGLDWAWGADRLHAARGRLRFIRGAASLLPRSHPARRLVIDGPGRFRLDDWRGTLLVQPVPAGGVALARLVDCELRARQGGERFQAGPNRPARSLKKQYQAADVAVWLRDGPLLHCGSVLVFVAGLGLDARVIGADGPGLVALSWEPDAAR